MSTGEAETTNTDSPQTPENPFDSFGELLEEEDLGGELNRTVYEALEEDLGYEGEASSRILAGEFGAGTPVEAFDAYLGLQIWGRMTGHYEEADDFLIGGGLQIKDPNRWGKRQEAYLREYRQDPESDEVPEPERLENVAKAAGIDSLEEIENYEDELRGLLTSSGAHREYVRDRMDEMLSGFEGRIEYAMGEEERDFNRKEEQARWINKLAKEIEDYREEKEGELEEAKESREELLERIDQIQDAYDVVSTLHEKIEGFYHNKKNDLGEEELQDELESKKQELWNRFELEIDELDDNYQRKIEDLFEFDQGWEEYREDYDEIDDDWGEIGEQLESLDTRVSDLKDDIAEVEWEEDHYVFSNLSNRKHIKAADAKVLNYLAMRSIQEDVMETFPREVRDQVDIHDRKQAEIDGEQEMPEELVEHRERINRIEKLAAETDYDRESLEDSSLEELERLAQEHDLDYEEEATEADFEAEEDSLFGDSFLMHNTKWTNTPSEMSMMEALYEAQRKHRHSDRIKGDEDWGPDSIYVPHNAAGFEYTRRNLDRQLRDKWDDFEEDPHEVSVLTMPPLIDMENLEEEWASGTQNVHTKKIYKGDLNRSIPTGVVVQTRLEDDSEIPFLVPEDLLTDIGKLGRQALETDTESEEYDEILEEIEQLSEMRLGSVLANADWHEGKVNSDVGLSHREKIWRTLNYQAERYGDSEMPQSVLYSELIDGDQSWYGEENHSNGETTSWMRDELHDQLMDEEILEAAEELNQYYESDIGEEDIPRIMELQGELLDGVLDMSSETLSEFTENTESLPVPGASKQSKGTEPYLRFLDENLDPASYLLLTGNHPNSDIGHDEAHEIERALYKTVTGDLDAETFLFDGQGTKHGGFGAKKDKGDIFGSEKTGRKFYLQHVTSGAKHYMRKIGKDLVDGGKDAADQVILNHIHKFGHKVLSDGTHVTVTPSVWNTDQVGEVSGYGHSSWGIAAQLVNAAPEDHPLSDYDLGGVHYIGPETLHRDEFSGDPLENEFSELEENVEAVNHDEIAETAEEFMEETQPEQEEPEPVDETETPDKENDSSRVDQLLETGELDAEELLKMRFVEGEISREEYQERMAVI